MKETKTVTGEGKAPRVSYADLKKLIPNINPRLEHVGENAPETRDTGEGKAPRDYKHDFENLLAKVNELRRAWIAPHRFSEQKASLQLAELADYYAIVARLPAQSVRRPVITLYKQGRSWFAKFGNDAGTETAFTSSAPVSMVRRELQRLNPEYDVWVL